MRQGILKPESTEPDTPDVAARANFGSFWPILLLIALVGLVVRLYVGWKTFIDFDEWQHIFMAGGARWADISFELRTNAHPPLFFLLLRPLVLLAPGNPAFYRSISIAAGAGSIVIVGLIARKIFDSPVIQLVCAAVFALSVDAITISDEIRSYQLAVFFLLLAFLSWLAMFPPNGEETGTRPFAAFAVWPFVAFALCSSLAISSHYSAVFFPGACLAVSPFLFSLRGEGATTKRLWLLGSALAVPLMVFAVQYFIHASVQPIQGYLFDFYQGKTPGESAAAFAVRNARNFSNLFSPIQFRSVVPFLSFLLLLAGAAAWALARRFHAGSAAGKRSAGAILVAAVIVLELLAASLFQKYPFGGMLRHQYVAGPFLLIGSFVVLDCVVSPAGQSLRLAICGLVLAASITNLIAEVPGLIQYPGAVLMEAEFKAWQAAFPDARAVYLDHWGVIAYLIHPRERPRTFVRRVADDAVIDEYYVPDERGGTEISYDKTRDSLDFSDPSVYRSFAACLRASGVEELTLFFFSPGGKPFGQSPEKMQKLVTLQAAQQGMTTTKIVVAQTYLFAGFRLAESN
jgi:hypothetical protein